MSQDDVENCVVVVALPSYQHNLLTKCVICDEEAPDSGGIKAPLLSPIHHSTSISHSTEPGASSVFL